MAAALSHANLLLDGMEESIKNLIINADPVEANTIIFNNDTLIVNGLEVSSVNALEVDEVLDKVLDITEGFSMNNSMDFEVVVTQKNLSLGTLNGLPLKDYVSLSEDLVLEELDLQGFAAFEGGLLLENPTINNVEFAGKNWLLKEGDQDFAGNLSVAELEVIDLTSKSLDLLPESGEPISNVEALNVKHLRIGGLLNNVDVKSLEKRGLKKSGNQFWGAPLTINSLEVQELRTKGLSGKLVPQDLVLVNGGQYQVDQDVFFKGSFH